MTGETSINLIERLRELGCQVGVAKSGRILRVDNRDCPTPLPREILDQIVECDSLKELYLRSVVDWLNPNVSKIAALQKMKQLDVEGSDFNDDSLMCLKGCPALQVLNVRNTHVSESTVSELRKLMINTRIIFQAS